MDIRYETEEMSFRGISTGRMVEREGRLVGYTQNGRYMIVENIYGRRSWVLPSQVREG